MLEQTTSTGNHETKHGCKACAVNFDSREAQRAHMKEDWHVYNLKRRIASLPPISSTKYHERVVASNSGNESEEEPSTFEKSCIACEQHYTNRPAWQAHLKSRNHVLESARSDLKTSMAPDQSLSPGTVALGSLYNGQQVGEEEHFSPLRCLFCNTESASLESNLTHMSLDHSFFIPDSEYLVDIGSFLRYLFIVISTFYQCLYCGSARSNKFAVQDHMRGKGHCKIDFEDDDHEFEQFYDFSREADEDLELEEKLVLVPDEDELHLPSGKTLGHRSRVHRSRRKLPEHGSLVTSSQTPNEAGPTPTPTVSNDRRVAMRNGTSTSMIGVPELQQRALMAVERKTMKIEMREMNEYQSKVDKGGNKQKRFRCLGIGKKQGGLEKRLG